MESTEEIKIGDVVYLKSGSPRMVVTQFVQYAVCDCLIEWFVGDEHCKGSTYLAALTKVNPNPCIPACSKTQTS